MRKTSQTLRPHDGHPVVHHKQASNKDTMKKKKKQHKHTHTHIHHNIMMGSQKGEEGNETPQSGLHNLPMTLQLCDIVEPIKILGAQKYIWSSAVKSERFPQAENLFFGGRLPAVQSCGFVLDSLQMHGVSSCSSTLSSSSLASSSSSSSSSPFFAHTPLLYKYVKESKHARLMIRKMRKKTLQGSLRRTEVYIKNHQEGKEQKEDEEASRGRDRDIPSIDAMSS